MFSNEPDLYPLDAYRTPDPRLMPPATAKGTQAGKTCRASFCYHPGLRQTCLHNQYQCLLNPFSSGSLPACLFVITIWPPGFRKSLLWAKGRSRIVFSCEVRLPHPNSECEPRKAEASFSFIGVPVLLTTLTCCLSNDWTLYQGCLQLLGFLQDCFLWFSF